MSHAAAVSVDHTSAGAEPSFSAGLMKQIENFYERLKTENKFFLKIENGTLSVDEAAALLHNTHYLIFHTPLHMKTAVELSQRADCPFPELLEYYSEHAAEEVDHHIWAEDDLRRLGRESKLEEGYGIIAPKMRELVSYVHSQIQKDVALYLPYILYAEYLSVVAVGESVVKMRERCGIQTEALTVFTYHAELDQGHAGHDGEIIDGVIAKAPHYKETFPQVIAAASQIYFEFLESIVIEATEEKLEPAIA